MTAEFGPRDERVASLPERLAAVSISLLTRFTNWKSLEQMDLRFRSDSATFVVSGESEQSGERYSRGISVGVTCLFAGLVPVLAVLSVGPAAIDVLEPFRPLGEVLLLFSFVFALVNLFGVFGVLTKIDVIDHTTEPEPEAVAELREQFVDGEIDERELAARVEEVLERE